MNRESLSLCRLMLIGFATFAFTAGCYKAASPQTNAYAVTEAYRDAVKEVADARNDAAKDINSARADVQEKPKDLNQVPAKSDYELAVAQANGEHEVAVEKCEALAGDAQTACNTQADATSETAKVSARQTLVTQK